jgi:uncharacterized protein YdeI (YjbR/CyaY-like superfamily)
MATVKISNGTVHRMPADIAKVLLRDTVALAKWETLTPLGRNEWICWVTFVKQAKTRQEHIERLVSEVKEGKRRPCCWIGCIHRKDKALSPSIQGLLNKRKK